MEALINAIFMNLLKMSVSAATWQQLSSYQAAYAYLGKPPADLSRENIPQLEELRNRARAAFKEWETNAGPFWNPDPEVSSTAALTGSRLFAQYLVQQWTLDNAIIQLPGGTSAPSTSAPGTSAPSTAQRARKTPSASSPSAPGTSAPGTSAPGTRRPAPADLPEIKTEESMRASSGGILFGLVAAGAFLWFMLRKKK